MATQELISKTLGSVPTARITPANERRSNRRCKMSMSHEYLAEVVRVEPMSNGMFGIGFKYLMQMGSISAHSYGISVSRK